MRILYLDPTKRDGMDGFFNYNLSGAGSDGGNNGSGCGIFLWIFVIWVVFEFIVKYF